MRGAPRGRRRGRNGFGGAAIAALAIFFGADLASETNRQIVVDREPGQYLAMFHDDGRYFENPPQLTKPPTMTLYKTFSRDGGRSWSLPEAVFQSDAVHRCEPGVVRSPDGRQLAVLLRENRRVRNAHVIFSDDEGTSWTAPRELPGALTGDRHTAQYAPDGTFVATTHGHWIPGEQPFILSVRVTLAELDAKALRHEFGLKTIVSGG